MTSQEMERNIEEIWQLFRETDRRLAENFEKTDQQFQEIARDFAKTERIVRDVSRQVGKLGNSWGEFVEGLVIPAVEKGLFEKYGIPVRDTGPRRKARKGGEEMEMDVIAVNGDKVVVLEVKSCLREEHVDKHIEKLARFKEFFTDYKDRKILGGVAGATFVSGVDNYAIRKGLFVIKQRGDHVEIANQEEFRPKEW